MKFGIFDISLSRLTKKQKDILTFFEFMKTNNLAVNINLWGCDARFDLSGFDKSFFEKTDGIYYGFHSRLAREQFSEKSIEEIFETMRKNDEGL